MYWGSLERTSDRLLPLCLPKLRTWSIAPRDATRRHRFNILRAEPDRQFQLVREHIDRLRTDLYCSISKIIIFVERNLGFEAEHHHRALSDYPGVEFYMDHHAQRVGVLTTNDTKHAMCAVLSTMMRERRVHVRKPAIVSRDPAGILVRLREQLEIYSYQFKAAQNTFVKDKVALSGKVGGMKDDLCICLQLGVYWTNVDIARRAVTGQKAVAV